MDADLISRKALIEAVEKLRLYVTPYTNAADIVRVQGRLFRKAVDEASAVEAVPVVHGRWILTNGEDGLYYDCSICGHCAGRGRNSKYCPNCGAKMDGGKDT